MLLKIQEMMLDLYYTVEWLWSYTIILRRCIDWQIWGSFENLFSSFKMQPNFHFLPMRFTMQCLYSCFDGFVLIIVLVKALPLKNLNLPDWFALRNNTATYSRAVFQSFDAKIKCVCENEPDFSSQCLWVWNTWNTLLHTNVHFGSFKIPWIHLSS